MARRSAPSQLRAREQGGKLGTEVLQARIGLGLSRQQAADRAGVSWQTQLRVELGDPNVGLATMCAVGEAVGLDVVLRVYQGRQPSLRDTGQLQFAQQLVDLAHASWHPDLEHAVGPHGQACDLAFFGAQEILDVEIERMASDFQGQLRRADEKRKLLSSRHQRPVRLILVVEDTPRNRAAVAEHLPVIRSALPAGSREILAAIRTGRPLGRDGLLWLRRRPAR